MKDARVDELLEELLDSESTPEQVCRDCPELLPQVRAAWQRVRALKAEVGALFPDSTPTDTATSRTVPTTDLPRIRGYEVQEVLGRGGVGVVYKAWHLRLQRAVALKMLLSGPYARPEELERFLREAEAVAGLRHANIVQVYDVGDVDGRPYFTMEFVEGGSLARELAGAPLPARRAAALVAAVADAVAAAHQSGVIHRDLKPSNILLTADGTPKVTDFGLARRLEGGAALTLTGAPMGTPSYMAPEQARGDKGALGPATDVYSLGAVLYECLTGRPPFRAETATATLQQVVADEPAPPARLNPRVPRDLETICLKCLHKEPSRRYASAAALADDLRRFLDGRPILARPIGVLERAVKWARRRPGTALLLATLLLGSVTAAGTVVWLRQQEADSRAAKARQEGQAREAIETALRRAGDLRLEERWKEALNVLTDAVPHLGEANSPELDQRLRQAQADFQIASDLERVRESRTLGPGGEIDYQRQAADYQGVFDRVGLRISEVEPTVAAIRASAIRDQFAAALDDWAVVAFTQGDAPSAARLLEIARSADPEPRWGDRFRTPAVWESGDRLRQLAADAFTTSPPPPGHQLALLGLLLRHKGAGNRHSEFLCEACRRHPANFWLNRETGFALSKENRLHESAGYYRAALAARPESARVHEDLGWVLFRAGEIDEALAEYRRAVECAPADVPLRGRFMQRLAEAGYWKDAAAECRRGLEIEPKNPLLPVFLAQILAQHQRDDEAIALLNKAIEIDRSCSTAHYDLGSIYARVGRHAEAATAFRALADLSSTDATTRQQLARELTAAGRPVEAIDELRAAIALRPTPSMHLDLGNLLRSQGRSEEAATAFRQATAGNIEQAWDGLAAVRLDQGRFADARAATEHLLALPVEDSRRRALRRQLELCDSLLTVEAKLPAILAGKERPTDATTWLALAVWCQKHRRLTATAAGFYASAFTAQPSLADDLGAGNRFQAARAAALAGCGTGEDAARLGDPRRAELRKQALDWLTADYTAWAEKHRAKPGDRTAAATAVRAWLTAQDLAGVRDEPALARLPADERRDWQAFWEKVAAVAARDPKAKVSQAHAHVGRVEWTDAARCYAEAMELEPTENSDIWFELAATQLLAGDRPGYRRSCTHMLARCQPAGSMRPYLVARACTLAPDSTDDPAQPLRLAEKELDRNGVEFWSLTERGALHIRAGRPKDAVPQLEWSLEADSRPGRAVLNWLWLALACQKMDRPTEARRWLAKAVNWLDQQDGRMPPETSTMGLHLHNWLEAQVLRREVKALLR